MITRLLKNDFLFSLVNRGVSFAFSLIISICINRYLGVAQRGAYSYWINVISLITIVLSFGMHAAYPYFKRQGMANLLQQFTNLYALQFLGTLAIGLIISQLVNDVLLALVVLCIPINLLATQVVNTLNIEFGRARYVLRTTSMAFWAIELLTLMLATESSLILIFVAQALYILFMLVFASIKLGSVPNPFKFSWEWAKPVLAYGFFPMLSLLLQTLNYRVDVLMLERAVTPIMLGYYTFGNNIAEQLWIIPDSLREVLAARTAKDDATDMVVLSLKMANLIMLAVIIVAILFGKFAIRILFGVEFAPAYSTMILLFFGIPSMSWYMVIGTVLNAQGKRRLYFFVMLFGVLINVGLNCVLIPVFDITGAAFASIVSYTFCGIILMMVYARQINIPVYKLLLPSKADFAWLKRQFLNG